MPPILSSLIDAMAEQHHTLLHFPQDNVCEVSQAMADS